MGTSLNGLTPAGTYPGLIKTGDNAPIDGTLKTLSDGNGNNLPMSVSTTAVNFTGTLTQAGATLQPTLVSGTNIKTINGTSLLGSGNIPVVTSPSGVAGAIQFSNGSAFASDAANLFWDDTNNRLGVGTNSPTARAHILGVGATSSSTSFLVQNSLGHNNLKITDDGLVKIQNDLYLGKFIIGWPDGSESLIFDTTQIRSGGGNPLSIIGYSTNIGSGLGTRLTTSNSGTTIYGSGSTSATTSLLVQNSAGTAALTVKDDLSTTFGSSINANYINMQFTGIYNSEYFSLASGVGSLGSSGLYVGSGGILPSAIIQANSTTKGFLPPVMTTTQKNAIATPAAGLVVYDSTTNKLCCYNGSTWNDLF